MDVSSEIDYLRIQLYNLLRLCCKTEKEFSSARYLMESMVAKTGLEIAKKMEEDE